MGVRHLKPNGAVPGTLASDFHRRGRGIGSGQCTRTAVVPKTHGVKAIATAHIQNGAARHLPGGQDDIKGPLGGEATTESVTGGINVTAPGSILIERLNVLGVE